MGSIRSGRAPSNIVPGNLRGGRAPSNMIPQVLGDLRDGRAPSNVVPKVTDGRPPFQNKGRPKNVNGISNFGYRKAGPDMDVMRNAMLKRLRNK